MKLLPFKLSSSRARLAGAFVALVCSAVSLVAVLAAFASASGELDPVIAKFRVAPAASEVEAQGPARPAGI